MLVKNSQDDWKPRLRRTGNDTKTDYGAQT